MHKELILAVTVHRKFGAIITPFIITPVNGNSFYSSIEKANTINVKEVYNFNDTLLKIVKLICEYDDTYIASLFTKKKEDAKTFIQNVDYEFINLRIRPHIEKRILTIIKLLSDIEIPIYYKDRKYTKIYKTDRITFAGKSARAIFNFNRNSEGIQYFLSIKHNNTEIKLKHKKAFILTQSPCSIVLDDTLYYFDNLDSKKLSPFFDKDYIEIPKQTEQTYFEKFILSTIKQFEVKASGFNIDEEKLECKPLLYLQNDLKGAPVLLLKFKYGAKVILPNNPETQFTVLETINDDYRFIKNTRDTDKEKWLYEQFKKLGLNSSDHIHFYPKAKTIQPIDQQIYFLLQWVNQNSEALSKMGVEIKQGFFERKYYTHKISLTLTVSDDNDWFDIRGTVELGDFKIPFIKLRKNIIRNIREYELPDGNIAILPEEWFAKYKEIFLFAEHHTAGLTLNKMHFNLLNVQTTGINSKYAEEIKKLFDNKYAQNATVPANLKANLRPYQITGYSWMAHLRTHKFGGCLADDMGLGKTLQTLTLLLETSTKAVDEPTPPTNNIAQLSLFDAPITTSKNKIKPSSLIVMPASLIHNWRNEIEKFTPDLKCFVHTGNNRTKDIWQFKNFDIVLTTYGVIRNDYELLKLFPFQYIILDESQVIKNPDSKIYKAIIQLKAKYRLVLTGTPIENSLTDLWSQMNFVNKGILGSFNFFKNEFVQPIEKHNNADKSEKLQALIHPFILRRTKEQVAKDLPPRTEQIRFCEMSENQRKIYEEEKSLVRNNILENMERNGSNKSAMMILQALTRLRQLANHPLLLDINEDSGKFEEVTRMLQNILTEGHKVLVFSSFVQYLNLYARYLESENLKYSLLTGQTQNREKVIEEFQNNSDINVFLISLKAGGVGLNLTAADYVFILDPWWNPAAENQAINRAHRIGQDKKVFVYRFISEDSIEEKIMGLQTRKSELADLFINTNNPFKALTPDKIKELFN